MTTEIINEQLNAIVGRSFNYKQKNVVIDKFKDVNSTNVVVFMNGRPTNFLYSEIEVFLSELQEPVEGGIPKGAVAIPESKLAVFQPTLDNKELKDTLMETLRKVKGDANYIPQATAVCEVVNQYVAVQKTEIQMLNLINRYQK